MAVEEELAKRVLCDGAVVHLSESETAGVTCAIGGGDEGEGVSGSETVDVARAASEAGEIDREAFPRRVPPH